MKRNKKIQGNVFSLLLFLYLTKIQIDNEQYVPNSIVTKGICLKSSLREKICSKNDFTSMYKKPTMKVLYHMMMLRTKDQKKYC